MPRRQFPTTRYQGSKLRSLPFLERGFAELEFDSAVDVFGGTAAVSYLFKRLGKRTHYNDGLVANLAIGTALIENTGVCLSEAKARELFVASKGRVYDDVIARAFDGVFYLAEENRWLDVVTQNVAALADRFERGLALFSLFQACLKKRPFNLFHRANLDLRTRDVPRTFGNKRTWERPFEDLFIEALGEANRAVFDNGEDNRATCIDALACPLEADLVYLDPPYVRQDGSAFDYLDGYHFLDGLATYDGWAARIDRTKKHRPLRTPRSAFTDVRTAKQALFTMFERAQRSIIVVSYRADGTPTSEEMAGALRKLGKTVRVMERPSQYALAHARSAELLVIAH